MHTDAVSESVEAGPRTDDPGHVMRCKLALTKEMVPVIEFYRGHNGESIL
jgi:hypothetical protein